MTHKITIELTEVELKALSHVALDPDEWVENVTKERCRVAIEDIAKAEIQNKLDNGETIAGTKEEIVMNANIESAAEKQARILAEKQNS